MVTIYIIQSVYDNEESVLEDVFTNEELARKCYMELPYGDIASLTKMSGVDKLELVNCETRRIS